jgi:hypothetical protein
MEEQVGKFRALLHQVKFGHPFRFPFKFRGWNTHKFAQDVSGVIEGQRLIKITGEEVAL